MSVGWVFGFEPLTKFQMIYLFYQWKAGIKAAVFIGIKHEKDSYGFYRVR
jgi:hypothetical protein